MPKNAQATKTGMAAFSGGRREGITGVVLAFFTGLAVKVLSSGFAVLQETPSVHGYYLEVHDDFALSDRERQELLAGGFPGVPPRSHPAP